ncbi:sensor histidine kinase [Streptomyces clavuligerus]|uniref:sensor histidine kinase n=1 Tax=Streptomyces clavuligerus TaxID=1901 RepID=UPI001F072CBA|nr:HAMP domain-containing sensor histidine kinase [Streptomyces clavuligerus]
MSCPAAGVASLSAGQLAEIAERLRDDAQRQLLTMSALALLVMVVVSVVLGWWMAGRVLRPVAHHHTATARRLSSVNLHERIALDGPDDELKHLADTFDDMLDRLHRAFGSQRRFVANASHELRTPLAIQRAAIQIRLAGRARRICRVSRRSCWRPTGAGEPADRGPAAAGDQRSRPRPVRAGRPRGGRGGDGGSCGGPGSRRRGCGWIFRSRRCPVSGDRVLLGQLVENLVQNAVRYNVPGGAISVVTSPAPVGVRADGAETPARWSRRARRKGCWSRSAGWVRRRRPKDGAGLGLSIVQSIAQAQWGDVTVRANAEGGLEVRVAPASAADRARTGAGVAGEGRGRPRWGEAGHGGGFRRARTTPAVTRPAAAPNLPLGRDPGPVVRGPPPSRAPVADALRPRSASARPARRARFAVEGRLDRRRLLGGPWLR